MLFVLNRAEHFPWSVTPQDRHGHAFIEALGEALRHGWHAVHAPAALLDAWSQLPDLSRRQRVTMAETVNHLSGTAGRRVEPRLLSDTLVVTGPNGEHPLPDTWDGPAPRRISMSAATQLLRQPTLLGTENATDANWFVGLGRAWALFHEQDRHIAVETRGLGGSTAAAEAKNALQQGRMTLIILDSDKDHADASPGGTAATVLKEVTEDLAPDVPRCIEVLQARDVENLLPQALVEKLKGREWVAPMCARGVFLRPDQPPSPKLVWLDLGKNLCATALQHQGAGPAKEARQAALRHMAALNAGCDQEPCSYDPEKGFGCAKGEDPHKPRCDVKRPLVVRAVGKPLGDLLEVLEGLGDQASHELLAALPAPGSAGSEPVWGPAQRVWSWGLAFRPRLLPAAL
jgi:hypothetical protein